MRTPCSLDLQLLGGSNHFSALHILLNELVLNYNTYIAGLHAGSLCCGVYLLHTRVENMNKRLWRVYKVQR